MKRMMSFLCILGILFFMPVFSSAEDEVSELKERIIDIQNKGKLDFRNFALCSNILGYGQYVPIPDDKVKAGSKIYFYYEPVNLYTNRKDGTYHIWYTQDIILKKKEGEELYRGADALNFNYQTTSPVLDVFASNSVDLGELPPGTYEFEAVMHDKLKEVDASYTYTFEIIP